jgi:glycosyltransferase involved in cell wall biosynthesis
MSNKTRAHTQSVVMVVSNAFRPDPRVYREAKSLVTHGFRVVVYAWDRECKYPLNEMVDGILIKRIHLRSKYSSFFASAITLPLFWIFASLKMSSEKFGAIHCHDFDSVPVGLLVKALRRDVNLIYDAHEYYPAMVANQAPHLFRILLGWIDKVFAKTVDYVIIPCEERRRLYTEAKKIIVVPNTPKLVNVPTTAKWKGFSIFYGGKLSENNGILVMVEAVQGIQNAKLVLAGDGPLKDIVKIVSKANSNIRYLGFISHQEVLRNLASADASFIFYEPTNINNICSASNKLFEAMMIGVPVIVNKEISQSKIVRDCDCGVMVPYGDIGALRREIVRLQSSLLLRRRLGQNGKKAFRERFAWDLAETEFIREYEESIDTRESVVQTSY